MKSLNQTGHISTDEPTVKLKFFIGYAVETNVIGCDFHDWAQTVQEPEYYNCKI